MVFYLISQPVERDRKKKESLCTICGIVALVNIAQRGTLRFLSIQQSNVGRWQRTHVSIKRDFTSYDRNEQVHDRLAFDSRQETAHVVHDTEIAVLYAASDTRLWLHTPFGGPLRWYLEAEAGTSSGFWPTHIFWYRVLCDVITRFTSLAFSRFRSIFPVCLPFFSFNWRMVSPAPRSAATANCLPNLRISATRQAVKGATTTRSTYNADTLRKRPHKLLPKSSGASIHGLQTDSTSMFESHFSFLGSTGGSSPMSFIWLGPREVELRLRSKKAILALQCCDF